MVTAITPRRASHRSLALVSGYTPELMKAPIVGYGVLIAGAALFFGGVSGGWGLGLLGVGLGMVVAPYTIGGGYSSLSFLAFGLMYASPFVAYYLYQRPDVNRWYNKNLAR